MGNLPVAPAPVVDLLEDDPLEVELATTLIYEHCHYSYRQIRMAIQAAGERLRREIIDMGLRHRGRHDEMLRAFRAGQQFRFDILMDIGGFRDMHRHRRCIQIGQEFTTKHGYECCWNWNCAAAQEDTTQSCSAADGGRKIGRAQAPEAEENSQYAIPLASASGRCSRWISPRWSTSPSCERAGGTYLLPQRGLCDV